MRQYNQLLFRTARSMLKSDVEAEDAVQDAYLKAWRALSSFRSESKLSTWLVRIVTNEALMRLRRAKLQTVSLEDAMTSLDPRMQMALADEHDNGPEQEALRTQVRELIEKQIDQLPDAYRTVFMLKGVQEMSAADVADALGIPEATVRTRFFRGKKLLREALAGQIDADLSGAFSFDGARCDRMVANVLRRAREAGLSGPGHESPQSE